MNTKTININVRYYLAPSRVAMADKTKDWDVIDRALEYHQKFATVFSNGTEAECREWVLRNCEEPVEHTKLPIKIVVRPELSWPLSFQAPNGLFVGCCSNSADAALFVTSPKLLALLEQYHQSFPSKESGKLICEAKGWTTEGDMK